MKIADRAGLFESEGLEATFIQATPTNLVAGLLSGDLDYSVDLTAAAQAAMQQEVPLRLLMAISMRPQHRLMARPEIQTITDLRGRVIGINQQRDFTEWETRIVLERNGVSPDEVRFLAIPTSPARLAGLDTGQIVAAIMAVPFDLEAEARGYHELGKISREIDIAWIGLATRSGLIEANPDRVRRTLRAVLRGLEYVRRDAKTTTHFIQEWLSVDAASAAAVYNLGLETWSVDGNAPDAAWRNLGELAQLSGPAPHPLAVERLVARELLEEARRTLNGR